MKIFAIHAFTYLYAVMCCNLRRICAAFTQYVGCSKIELYALVRCKVYFCLLCYSITRHSIIKPR